MRSTGATARNQASKPTEPDTGNVVTLPGVLDEEDFALDGVLSELGAIDAAKVQVYRLPRDGGRMVYVATYTPDEVEGESSLLEAIRQEYGGGDYRIHVRNAVGLLANKRVAIAERKQPPQGGGDAGVVPILTAMFDRLQTTLATALQAQRPETPSRNDILQELKMMAEITATKQPSGGGVREVMEALKQGIDLGKSMQPSQPAGAGDMLTASLNAFAPLIHDAASRSRQVAASRPVMRSAAPVPAVGPAAVPAAAAPVAMPAEPAATDDAGMRELLGVVMRGAERGADPELYAELVIDQVGAVDVAGLVGQSDAPAMVAALSTIDTRVAAHAEWFAALHASMVEQLAELAAQPPEEPAGSDDESTVVVDGAPVRPGGGPTHVVDHG